MAIVRESRALVERSSDRRSTEGANGEKTVIYIYMYVTIYSRALSMYFLISIGRARASQGKSGTLGAGTKSSET